MPAHEPLYLMWQDTSKHLTPTQKALAGVAAYLARFGMRPLVCVCHQMIELPELTVQVRQHVEADMFWLGMEEIR